MSSTDANTSNNTPCGPLSPEENSRPNRLGYSVDRLLQGKSVTAEQIRQKFAVSERTARDDIVSLSMIRVKRFPAGIQPADKFYYDLMSTKNIPAKLDVAERAAELFDASASIAASPGTQVGLTYQKMIGRGIVAAIVTNSLALCAFGLTDGTTLTVVGGQFNPNINAVVGEAATKGFRPLECREGLLGVSGIDREGTLYVHHDAEVPVLKAMLGSVTEKLIIVADLSKIGRPDPWILGRIDSLCTGGRKVILVTNEFDGWQSELTGDPAKTKKEIEFLQRLQKQNSNFKLELVRRGYEKRND